MKNHLTLYPNLVAVRKAKCTQKELADYLGISQQEISRYERGEIKASINYLCDVADFCGVSVDFILGREPKDRTLRRPDETRRLELYERRSEENRFRLIERAETLSELQDH